MTQLGHSIHIMYNLKMYNNRLIYYKNQQAISGAIIIIFMTIEAKYNIDSSTLLNKKMISLDMVKKM